MANRPELPEALELYFGSSPLGPLLEVGSAERDTTHPLNAEMRNAFRQVAAEAAATMRTERFLSLYGHLPARKQDWLARAWVIIEELNDRITGRRARLLSLRREDAGRPPPYDQPAVEDLQLSEDCLVPLSEFDIQGGVLVRRGHAFTILPPNPSPNSSYWLTRSLDAEPLRDHVRVRLDPMLHGPAESYPQLVYKMLWWGPPLRWEDVRAIDKDQFGRWSPDSMSHGEFTDFLWRPRVDEVHLFLEEIPERDAPATVPSRYLHVIFSRMKDAVIHLDGACRFLNGREWAKRRTQHLKDVGKIGTRVKVFRLDGEIEIAPVSSLGATFFVWNHDVAHFFGAGVPVDLLGHAG